MDPFADMKCSCCHRPGVVGVASSGFVAMSFAWCKECLSSPYHPEPEWVLSYLYYEVGDHGQGLVDDEYLPGTWKDGRYWSFNEWKGWARKQPDPFWAQPTIDSSAWTGRRFRGEDEVPQWLVRLAWPAQPWGAYEPRWRLLLQRWLRFCWCW